MTEKCTRCSKEFGFFRWKYSCPECGQIICDDCFTPMPNFEQLCLDPIAEIKDSRVDLHKVDQICQVCFYDHIQKVVGKYHEALRSADEVEIVSSNYKGAKDSFSKDARRVETGWFNEKNKASRVLQVTAAWLGCKFVTKVEFTRDEGQEKNYRFSIWKATGVACNR